MFSLLLYLILIIDCEVGCLLVNKTRSVVIFTGTASTCESDLSPTTRIDWSKEYVKTKKGLHAVWDDRLLDKNMTFEYGFGCAPEAETYFEWKQVYEKNYTTIITLPWIEARHSKFTMTLENFDNNSYIASNFYAYTYNADNKINRLVVADLKIKYLHPYQTISVPDYNKKEKFPIYKYFEYVPVTFSCQPYLGPFTDVYIGLVDINHQINTYKTSKMTVSDMGRSFNGSILCCIIYTTDIEENVKHIKRHVKNKTVLYYDIEAYNEEIKSRHINDTGSNLSPIEDITPFNEPGNERESYSVLIILPSMLLAIVLAIILIIVVKTRCWKLSDARRTLIPIKNDPFYLNVLFRRECEEELREIDQHYEEIR